MAPTQKLHRSNWSSIISWSVALLMFATFCDRAAAQLDSANLQPRSPTAKKPQPPAPVKNPVQTPSAAAPKKKLPPPQTVGFKTRDAVQISATYYPSPLEKEA